LSLAIEVRMIGAYTETDHFAYPGWRLTVPGGPAGGHYKGFTHNYSTGTTIEPGDEYEADRAAGASSHDAVHASPRNPRGIYRSSGEVPPRPNASGAAMTYRGFQTKRHAGTSIAPGSFPAPFEVTDEDAFLAGLGDLGYDVRWAERDGVVDPAQQRFAAIWRMAGGGDSVPTAPIRVVDEANRPNTVAAQPLPAQASAPATGATSVVNQPPPVLIAPAPAVSNVPGAPPISPAPAPVVASPAVVPSRDGSGNYIRVSDGSSVSASDVYQNPATGEWQAAVGAGSGITSWLAQNSLWSAVPNWAFIAAGAALLLLSGKRR
jgi:hypothetical protein